MSAINCSVAPTDRTDGRAFAGGSIGGASDYRWSRISLAVYPRYLLALECYIMDVMVTVRETNTAETIRGMARRHHVVYSHTPTDRLAHHMTRLAGDSVELDEIEQLPIALQRAGHLSRKEAVRLQARYLREAKHGL